MSLLYGSWEKLYEIKSLSSLWFFPVLFLAGLISETVLYLLRKTRFFMPAVLLSSAVLLFAGFKIPLRQPDGWPWGANIALTAAGFMLIGFAAVKFFLWIYGKPGIYAFALTFVLLAAVLLIPYHLSPARHIYFHHGKYGDPWNFLGNALIQSFFVISLSMLIDKYLPGKKILTYIGQNTLGILVLHKPMVKHFGKVASAHGFSLKAFWPCACISVFVIGICLILSAVIERIDPVLLGKGKPRT